MPNENLKEYWSGYRNAKIYAYMWAIEHRGELLKALDEDKQSDNFKNGFQAGLEAMQVELASMLINERSIESGEVQSN